LPCVAATAFVRKEKTELSSVAIDAFGGLGSLTQDHQLPKKDYDVLVDDDDGDNEMEKGEKELAKNEEEEEEELSKNEEDEEEQEEELAKDENGEAEGDGGGAGGRRRFTRRRRWGHDEEGRRRFTRRRRRRENTIKYQCDRCIFTSSLSQDEQGSELNQAGVRNTMEEATAAEANGFQSGAMDSHGRTAEECVDPRTMTPDSFKCKCVQAAYDDCGQDNEPCMRKKLCASADVCDGWKKNYGPPGCVSMSLMARRGVAESSSTANISADMDNSLAGKCYSEH